MAGKNLENLIIHNIPDKGVKERKFIVSKVIPNQIIFQSLRMCINQSKDAVGTK